MDWGTHVKQGQLLAVLEIPELQQQIQQDEASVRRSEQDLARAQRRTEPRAIGLQRRASHLHAARRRAKIAPRTGRAAGNRRRARERSGSERRRFRREGRARRLPSRHCSAAKAALEKDKAMFAYARMTAPFDGVVTEIYAYTGALLPAGTSSNKGDSALCRLSQNDLAAPGDSRAGKSRCRTFIIGETVAVNVSAHQRDLQRENRPLLRSNRHARRAPCTPKWTSPIPNTSWFPACMPRCKFLCTPSPNVLTVPVQAVQAAGEGKGAVLVVNASNQDREARRHARDCKPPRTSKSFRPSGKRTGRLRRASAIPGRANSSSPKLVEPPRDRNRSRSCHPLPSDILI